MNIDLLCEKLDAAANESDAEMADRVLLVYIAPGEAGLVIHRVGKGTHILSGSDDKDAFADRIMGALDMLWPEMPKRTRRYLEMGADMIARSPVARMISGGG